jgi:hypothetical protein
MREKDSFLGEFRNGALKVLIKENFGSRSQRAMQSQMYQLLSNTQDYDVIFEIQGWSGSPEYLMNTFHSLQTPLPLPRSVTFVSPSQWPEFSLPNHSYSPSEIGIPVLFAHSLTEALQQRGESLV